LKAVNPIYLTDGIGIVIKAPFRQHIDVYDKNGEIIDRQFESWVFPA